MLKLIVGSLGSPPEESLSFISSERARNFMRKLSGRPRASWSALGLVAPGGSDPLEYARCLDLIGKMLTFDPRNRITVDEALTHPFLSGVRDIASETHITPIFDATWEDENTWNRDTVQRLMYAEIEANRGSPTAFVETPPVATASPPPPPPPLPPSNSRKRSPSKGSAAAGGGGAGSARGVGVDVDARSTTSHEYRSSAALVGSFEPSDDVGNCIKRATLLPLPASKPSSMHTRSASSGSLVNNGLSTSAYTLPSSQPPHLRGSVSGTSTRASSGSLTNTQSTSAGGLNSRVASSPESAAQHVAAAGSTRAESFWSRWVHSIMGPKGSVNAENHDE